MKRYIVLLILLITAPFIESIVAQPPPPPPVDIPIDGGMGALLFAGMAYAVKKLYTKEGNKI